ncbi:MAG: OmpA family protein [Kiloniellales bacterium]|nr:OmpA family protein [Kiloniellales bacterium]
MLRCGKYRPVLGESRLGARRPAVRRGLAGRLRRLWRVAPVLVLSACAGGEGFDPAGWVTGEVAPPERISTEGFDPDAPFPNLSRVPDRPPRPSPKRDRVADVRDLASQRGTEARRRPPPAEVDTRPGAPPPPAPPPPGAGAPAPDAGAGSARLAAVPPGQLVAVFYFPGIASELDPADGPLLQDVALLHRQRGGALRIVGHAEWDAAGEAKTGQVERLRLSMTRASRVARRLESLGSDPQDLIVSAAGDAAAAAAGGARRQRVEIFLVE